MRLSRVCAHICLYGRAGSELQTQLSYVGSRPQLTYILPLPSRHLGWYQIILLGDRGKYVEQLARSRYLTVERLGIESATFDH